MTPRLQSTDFPAAIAALIPDIRQLVTGALRRQGADPDLAEDLIQEIVITLLGSASTYRPELGALRPWAHGVAMNVVKNYSRKRHRYQARFWPDCGETEACVAHVASPERQAQVQEAQARLAELIERMPRNQREIFLLIVIEELSHREAAERLGISEAAAKQRYHRAREYLTEKLGLSLDDHLGVVLPLSSFGETPPELRRLQGWRTFYEHTCRWALPSTAVWAFLLAGARPEPPSLARAGLHIPAVHMAAQAETPHAEPLALPALSLVTERRTPTPPSPRRKAQPRLLFHIQGITPGDEGGSSR